MSKIFNLTEERLIEELLKKDETGKYNDLLNRKLKTQEDVPTFWNMIEDMVNLFDLGVDKEVLANGCCRIFLKPTYTLFFANYLDDTKTDVIIKEQILYVYKQLRENFRDDILELVKYIKDNNYDFVTSCYDGGIKDYAIELYVIGQNPENKIRLHMSRDIKDIDNFKSLMDGIAEHGYSHIIKLWYNNRELLDNHKFCHERFEIYALSLDNKDYYVFDIYNSAGFNAKHHFILFDNTYGSETYKQIIEDKELLKTLLDITKKID